MTSQHAMEQLLHRVTQLEEIVTKIAKWTHFSGVVNLGGNKVSKSSLHEKDSWIPGGESRIVHRKRGRKKKADTSSSSSDDDNRDYGTNCDDYSFEDITIYDGQHNSCIKTEIDVEDQDPDFVIFPEIQPVSSGHLVESVPSKLPTDIACSNKKGNLRSRSPTTSTIHVQNSSEESNNEAEVNSLRPRKRNYQPHVWKKQESFSSLEKAKEHLRHELYTYNNTQKRRRGRKTYYKCRIAGCRGKAYLYLGDKSKTVDVFVSKIEHDHSKMSNRGVASDIKEKIIKLHNNGCCKPRMIQEELRELGIEPPKATQIAQMLTYYRSKNKLSISDI